MTSDEAPLRRGGGMKYAPLALPRRRLLLPALALGGLLLLADPTNASYQEHMQKGESLWNQGELMAAEGEYREAIRLKPRSESAHIFLGQLLEKDRKFDEAEKEYREGVRLKPNFAGAHLTLGEFLNKQRKFKEAEKEYREAGRLKPRDCLTLECLAGYLDSVGKRKEARIYWKRALSVANLPQKEWIQKRLAEPD